MLVSMMVLSWRAVGSRLVRCWFPVCSLVAFLLTHSNLAAVLQVCWSPVALPLLRANLMMLVSTFFAGWFAAGFRRVLCWFPLCSLVAVLLSRSNSLLFCKWLRCCFFLFFAMAPLPVWCAVGSLLIPSCCFPADSLQFRCWIANLFAAGSLLLCLGFAAGLMMVAMLPLGWFDVASCCWFVVALPSVHCLSCAGSSLVRCWFSGGSFVVHSCSVVGSCVVRWWFPVASLLTHSIFASV